MDKVLKQSKSINIDVKEEFYKKNLNIKLNGCFEIFSDINKKFLNKKFIDEKKKIVYISKYKRALDGGVLFTEEINKIGKEFLGFLNYDEKTTVNFFQDKILYLISNNQENQELQIILPKKTLIIYNKNLDKVYLETFDEKLKKEISYINTNVDFNSEISIKRLIQQYFTYLNNRKKSLKIQETEIYQYSEFLKKELTKKIKKVDYGISLN